MGVIPSPLARCCLFTAYPHTSQVPSTFRKYFMNDPLNKNAGISCRCAQSAERCSIIRLCVSCFLMNAEYRHRNKDKKIFYPFEELLREREWGRRSKRERVRKGRSLWRNGMDDYFSLCNPYVFTNNERANYRYEL